MRSIYLIYILLLLVLSSCQNHIEEIWINADGSALIEKTIDLSEMLSLIQMGAMMSPQDDSATNAVDDLFSREKFDTLIILEDIFKEAATEQGESYSRYWLRDQLIEMTENKPVDADSLFEVMEPLLDVKLRMQFDVKKEILDITTILPAGHINEIELPDMSSLSEIFSDKAKKADQFGMFDEDLFSSLFEMNDYEFSKKEIRIKVARPDTSTKSDATGFDELMGTFFKKDMENTIKVHVPGKIKSVNQAEATFKDNLVSYSISAERLKDSGDDIDLLIRYKAKRKYRKITP